MRDYVRIFTTCTFDPSTEPGAFRWLYFAKSPDDAALFNQNFWGGTPFEIEFNDYRWYGRNWEAIRSEMNSFYVGSAFGTNIALFREGTTGTFPIHFGGGPDIFIASPRQIGYNSLVEEK